MTNAVKDTQDGKDVQALSWEERIDAVHATGCDDWLTAAWAAMLIKQGIVPEKNASAVAETLLTMLAEPESKRIDGWTYFHRRQDWLDAQLGRERSGNLMVVRTTPPARQTTFVRYQLMKCMCQVYDMLEAVLGMAGEHAGTVMPGYTHSRHAQPTTFGHYLLSVFDAVLRSSETLERGYHFMSLNEMGCGALGGTSWPIDRDLVSEYLGMEGLIENANDAVSYTDGFLVLVCGLTNITNVISRLALDFAFWSGVEFGFLDVGSHGKSFLMPQKETNPNSMEIVRLSAGQMVGSLTSVAVAGLREPHGDGHGMLHMEDATLDALKTAAKCIPIITREMHQTKVNPERMKAVIEASYIASTELANQMGRDHGLDYRTAHEIIYKFVLASREAGIPATEARSDMLEEAARVVTGESLGMSDARLRELLDPAHFVEVTDSKGGVAPKEMERMMADRRNGLEDARKRLLARIETLEKARSRLEADLQAVASQ